MRRLVKPRELEVGELYLFRDLVRRPAESAARCRPRAVRWEPVVITEIWTLHSGGPLMYEYMKGNGSLHRIHVASFASVELKRVDDLDMVPLTQESK